MSNLLPETVLFSDIEVGTLFVFLMSGTRAIKLAETDEAGWHYVWFVDTTNDQSMVGKNPSTAVKNPDLDKVSSFGEIEPGTTFKFSNGGQKGIKLNEKDEFGQNYVQFKDSATFRVVGIDSRVGVIPIHPHEYND